MSKSPRCDINQKINFANDKISFIEVIRNYPHNLRTKGGVKPQNLTSQKVQPACSLVSSNFVNEFSVKRKINVLISLKAAQ